MGILGPFHRAHETPLRLCPFFTDSLSDYLYIPEVSGLRVHKKAEKAQGFLCFETLPASRLWSRLTSLPAGWQRERLQTAGAAVAGRR